MSIYTFVYQSLQLRGFETRALALFWGAVSFPELFSQKLKAANFGAPAAFATSLCPLCHALYLLPPPGGFPSPRSG